MRHAFDPRRRIACFLAGFGDTFGNGTDMNVGTAARHEHHVGEGRLSAQIERNDILRLGVIQTFEDRASEWTGVRRKTCYREKRSFDSFAEGRAWQRFLAPRPRKRDLKQDEVESRGIQLPSCVFRP